MISPEIIDAAQDAQRKWGVPASVTLAQFGLESSWGIHMPPNSCNGFGIKARPGEPFVMAQTHECVSGHYVTIAAPFRKFSSLAEAFAAHAALLAGAPIYQQAMRQLSGGISPTSVQAFIVEMASHYATDFSYATKLETIIREDKLSQYDQLPVTPLAPQPVVVQPSPSVPSIDQPQLSPAGLPPNPPGGAQPQGPMTSTPDFTPDPPVQLPSQVTAFLTGAFTHLLTGLAATLAGVGALQKDQEAQFATIGAGILLWATSLAITYIAQALRHKQAVAAVAQAKVTP